MNITYILDTFKGGGKERRCLQLIQGLKKRSNIQIQVLIINSGIEYEELNSDLCRIDILNRNSRGLGVRDTCREVKRIILDFHPDIVQPWSLMGMFFLMLSFPFPNFRVIGSYVADVIPPRFMSFAWFMNILSQSYCERIVGNSKTGLSAYKIRKSKSVLIYNGFNEDRTRILVSPDDKKQTLKISRKYVVGMFATFSRYKDHYAFINAARYVLSMRDDIVFLLVGDGPLYKEVKSKITERETQNIVFLGRRCDVDELYRICDVTILCSNTKTGEGISNSIIESMAFGIPVMATAVGATLEYLQDDINGILLCNHSSQYISERLMYVLDNDRYRYEIAQSGRNTVHEMFSLERMVNSFLDIYDAE